VDGEECECGEDGLECLLGESAWEAFGICLVRLTPSGLVYDHTQVLPCSEDSPIG
jgi:hypothetical protein